MEDEEDNVAENLSNFLKEGFFKGRKNCRYKKLYVN